MKTYSYGYSWMSAAFSPDKIALADILSGIMGCSRSELLRRSFDEFLITHLGGELQKITSKAVEDRVAGEF